MKIVIIKYNAGNVFSVECALQRLGIDAIITDNHDDIISADKVIFPGVGEASTAMKHLQSKNLDKVIFNLKQPVLGICIGLQLLCRHSEESDTKCIGVFGVDVKRFKNHSQSNEKIPHMGWNTIEATKSNILIPSNLSNNYAYYVHSYYAPICYNTIASTNYINEFSAALQKDNFYATQFHPEKSGSVGSTILKNFIEL